MTKQEKLKGLMEWLDSKGITYSEDYVVNGTKADLFVHGVHVAVSLDEDNSDNVFKAFREAKTRPFFIREGETMDFIIEKMQNLLGRTDDFGLRVSAQHVWHSIGWGKRHRHHLGFKFDTFLEEYMALAREVGKAEARKALVAKYKPMNIANTEALLKEQREKEERNRQRKKIAAERKKREEEKKRMEDERRKAAVPHKRKRIRIGVRVEKV